MKVLERNGRGKTQKKTDRVVCPNFGYTAPTSSFTKHK